MVRNLFFALAVFCLFLPNAAISDPVKYAEGQVWEYQTRPQDKGSLLKIQKIESLDPEKTGPKVFHISIVDVGFSNLQAGEVIPHLPVSRETLDKSVIKLSKAERDFPNPAEGITIWRDAKGGMFTISISEIVEIVEQAVEEQNRP